MKNIFGIAILLTALNQNLWSQKKYPQKLENDICTNLIIGNFKCSGCAASEKDLPNDVREDVIETLQSFKYCNLLNREKLAQIIQAGDEEEGIASLNADQRTKLREYYQAERILFGQLKIQSNGSLLVTIEISNLTTSDQEGYKRFTIPVDKYKNYESRQPFVEDGIVTMLLGSDASEISKNQPKTENIESPNKKSASEEAGYPDISGIWYSAGNGILTIDQNGEHINGIADGLNPNDGWRFLKGSRLTGVIDKNGSIISHSFNGDGSYVENESKVSPDGNTISGSWHHYTNPSKTTQIANGYFSITRNEIEKKGLTYTNGYPDIKGTWYSKGNGAVNFEQNGEHVSGIADGINPDDNWRILKGGKYVGKIQKDKSILFRIYWGDGSYSEDEMEISSNGQAIGGKWNWYTNASKITKNGSGYYILTKKN